MAVILEVGYVDVFGKVKNGRFTIGSAANAPDLLAVVKLLTNCQITHANVLTPVDISALGNNTPAAADMSSAEAQARITLTGDIPAGGTRKASTSCTIPAFVATFVTGGDQVLITDSTVRALISYLKDKDGNAMTAISSGRVL